MRTRVVARSFYEDAYLGFFIRYYLDLGFNEVVILKADADIFGGPKIPQYAIDTGLITQEELDSDSIRIIPVSNTGNDIIRKYYSEFKKPGVDWVLNVDLDEFLVIDLEKYPGGINEYITSTKQRLVNKGKIDNPDNVQQLKFRWLCINKMNCQFNPVELPIVNNAHSATATLPASTLEVNAHEDNKVYEDKACEDKACEDKACEDKACINGLSLSNYVGSNALEMYSFVKSMADREHMVDSANINCHFFQVKKVPVSEPADDKKIIHKRFMFIDDLLLAKNTYRSLNPPSSDITCRQGYILHLNTRSLANAFTKCLVTQLRDNKKLQNADGFRQWIQRLDTSPEYLLSNKESICDKFMSFLGSKRYFPQKISAFHHRNASKIDIPAAVDMFNNTISSMPLKTQRARVGNIEIEWQQLSDLCKKNKLPFSKVKAVLELF